VRAAFGFYLGGIDNWDRDRYLDGLQRRLAIARAWSLFFAEYPVLLMPTSWERPFPIDADTRSQARMESTCWRRRARLCLAAGEIVERAAHFSALERLIDSGA